MTYTLLDGRSYSLVTPTGLRVGDVIVGDRYPDCEILKVSNLAGLIWIVLDTGGKPNRLPLTPRDWIPVLDRVDP